MSTLKVDNIRHNSATSDAITMASDGTCTAKLTSIGGGGLSHRNKFINGAMNVSQRATSFTSTLADDQYTLDRFKHIIRGANDSHYTQVSDHPDNFRKSMKVKCNSTHTPSASDNAGFQSMLEGQDLQDLNFGSANANSFTVSFYAKSASQNNNHQYTFQIRSYPSGGATTRIMNFPFIVTTSWQRFSFTFTGDTGADIRNDNATGMALLWNLNAGPDDITSQYTNWTTLGKYMCVTGQSNFLDNTNNEFYLTGVQLEVGDTATSFEHISYGEELRRCERYFQCMKGYSLTSTGDSEALYGIALAYRNNRTLWSFQFKTEMRTNPTVSMSNLAYLQGLGVVGGWNAASSFVNTNKFSKFGGRVDLNWSGTPYTQGHAVEMRITNDGILSFVAEL